MYYIFVRTYSLYKKKFIAHMIWFEICEETNKSYKIRSWHHHYHHHINIQFLKKLIFLLPFSHTLTNNLSIRWRFLRYQCIHNVILNDIYSIQSIHFFHFEFNGQNFEILLLTHTNTYTIPIKFESKDLGIRIQFSHERFQFSEINDAMK